MDIRDSETALPRVVIVGGGFGGLKAAKTLRRTNARVTLVDKYNYHLFQPLLYQVATGGLSPANIATPLRAFCRRQRNLEVFLAEVIDFDAANQRVMLIDGELEYDYLIVAAGATHSYFGNDAWQQIAPGLKTLADAANIRRRIFLAFEKAERESDPEKKKAWMTFVIVGGGPTGVELAGALSEIAQHTLKNDFRHIDSEYARILLVEAGESVLSSYDPELRAWATAKIRSLGIEVLTESKVTSIERNEIIIESGNDKIILPTSTVLWAAGVQASPLGRKLATACDLETDKTGRVTVNETLNVEGYPNLYVIGDLARCLGADNQPLPGVAPVAIQQGRYVARRIASLMREPSGATEPFQYRDLGSMATIGRAAAVAQIGKRKFRGRIAWIFWLVIHLRQIVQFHNRMLVFFQWAWSYLTFGRSARLITGEDPYLPASREEAEIVVQRSKLLEGSKTKAES
jgi:NADH:ubiquinone reductase (H+-translocating)